MKYMQSGGVPVVVLRPATIYGPGAPVVNPMIGFRYRRVVVVLGGGGFVLPLVYVDDVVDAIVRSIELVDANGQIFNVVDRALVTKRQYVDNVIRPVFPSALVVYVPYSMVYSAVWVQELLLALLRRRPFLTRYRLTASQRSVLYDNSRLVECLGWRPLVSPEEAFARIVSFSTETAGMGR